MEIRKVQKGKKTGLPCGVVSQKSGGWTPSAVPEESGLLVVLSAAEQMAGGVFLPDSRLKEAGYVPKKATKPKTKPKTKKGKKK